MKVGITTYNLNHPDFQQQLSSLLKNSAAPDFIILHYGGGNSFIRYFNFIRKTVKQYRFKSFNALLKRVNKIDKKTDQKFFISVEERKINNDFLKKVTIIKTKGINDDSTINKLRNLGEAVILCNSGILKEKVLSLNNIYFLNIHASRLPQYRGMNNVEWALFENNELYVTIHKISRGMDEGDILYQEKIETQNIELKSVEDYRNYCYFKSYAIVGKAIRKLLDAQINFVKQEKKYEPLLVYYVMHPILRTRLQQRLTAKQNS